MTNEEIAAYIDSKLKTSEVLDKKEFPKDKIFFKEAKYDPEKRTLTISFGDPRLKDITFSTDDLIDSYVVESCNDESQFTTVNDGYLRLYDGDSKFCLRSTKPIIPMNPNEYADLSTLFDGKTMMHCLGKPNPYDILD